MNSELSNNDLSGDCISDNLLLQYLEGNLNAEEAERVQEHLNHCSTCFEIVVSLMRSDISPLPEQEKAEVQKLLTLSAKEQVEKILLYQRQLNPSVPEIFEEAESGVTTTRKQTTRKSLIKNVVEDWLAGRRLGQLAAASIILFFCTFGVYKAVKYYQTGQQGQVAKVEDLLLQKHREYIEEPRLSGGYQPTGISTLMSDGKEQPYLKDAQSRLRKTLNSEPQSLKAKQLLFHVYIIKEDYPRADSMLTIIEKDSKASPLLLNDIGVFHSRQREWEKAAQNFQAALKAAPDFPEARFNLALAKMKMGEKEEALNLLREYIHLEKDDGWRKAAQRLIDLSEPRPDSP